MKKMIGMLLMPCFFVSAFVLYGQQLPHPGGVTGSRAWIKTAYNKNLDKFEWKDFSCDTATVNNQVIQNGQFTQGVIHLNFNPTLQVSEKLNSDVILNKTNLSQATIIGVFGKRRNFDQDAPLYNVKGRPTTDFVSSTDKINTVNQGEQLPLDYGSDIGKDLRYSTEENNEGSLDNFKETTHRVFTYKYKEQPNFSIWGERCNSKITFGDVLDEFTNRNTNEGSWEWNIPEFLVFDRLLTPEERIKAETYLALKYGVTIDENYTSSWDAVLWDLSETPIYNNRITGLINDATSGLFQSVSHTSNEESVQDNFFSFENDSYHTEFRSFLDFLNPELSRFLLPTGNRLLTVGVSELSDLLKPDSTYAVWGDNNKAVKTTARKALAGARLLERVWKMNTNISSTSSAIVSSSGVAWDVNGLDFQGDKVVKTLVPVDPTIFPKTAITTTPLLGSEGVLSLTVPPTHQRISLRFTTNSNAITSNAYGIDIRYNSVYLMRKGDGPFGGQWIANVSGDGDDTVELVKEKGVIRVLIRRTDNFGLIHHEINIDEADQNLPFFGAILTEPSHQNDTNYSSRHEIKNFIQKGFVEDGMFTELSTKQGKAFEFVPNRLEEHGYESYLIIDKSGKGDFSNIDNLEFIERSRYDANRQSIIFENFAFDTDRNEIDAFTFGYKKKDALIAVLTEQKPTCNIDSTSVNNGSLHVDIEFGTGPFEYQLTGINETDYKGEKTSISNRDFTIYNLESGNYLLDVIDSHGNTTTVTHKVFLRATCEEEVDFPDDPPFFLFDNNNPEDDAFEEQFDANTNELITAFPVPARMDQDITLRLDNISGKGLVRLISPSSGLVVFSERLDLNRTELTYRLNVAAGVYYIQIIPDDGRKIRPSRIVVY